MSAGITIKRLEKTIEYQNEVINALTAENYDLLRRFKLLVEKTSSPNQQMAGDTSPK